jgi:hypothetical protein
MKTLNMGFQQCINLKSSTEFGLALEVLDAQIWLFWHQYKMNKFLRMTWPKIFTLGPWQERVKGFYFFRFLNKEITLLNISNPKGRSPY